MKEIGSSSSFKSNRFTRGVEELLNYPDELMVCIWTDEKFLVIAKLLNELFSIDLSSNDELSIVIRHYL